MRLSLPIPRLLSTLLLAQYSTPALAIPTTRRTGSLSFLPDESLFTFSYSTVEADAKNWIGIYPASGGGPENQTFVEPSLVWGYAPEAEGTVKIEGSGLVPGDYRAFFLAMDGYAWLASPTEVRVPYASGPVAFLLDEITLKNARVADGYEARIDGLRSQGGCSEVTFHKVKGSEWIAVSADGLMSGTPDRAGSARVTVELAAAADGTSDRLEITIPVKPAGAPLLDEVAFMTFNLWHGGTQVSDYHAKQIRFLASSGADVVGVQEGTGGHATRLGEALGWYSWQGGDVGFVSRYPLAEAGAHEGGTYAASVRVLLDGEGEQVALWNVHLGYDPYGPYDFCFDNMTVEEVLAREAESKRTPQITSVVGTMATQLGSAEEISVVLMGDFNAPSHLDWVDATRGMHCGRGDVPWPTSVEPTGAGLVDSYRVVYPDPRARPGITWSPIYHENEGRPEPMDRIDFVYFRGSKLEVVGSEVVVVGEPAPEPGHEWNEWTSDHAAVLTRFKIGN
ncbi:endonuclease/exonuclease/phosphatase family [Colletotrichum orchidophilum]|uniref:Endonuclease/exonuclease/phosphatase family n=1 Tax=Colletotrichum orchidophilum TaxID=1209926 RepID=A0A1G4B0X2_9PEZI|nr:endonuclease/exonuclease/phosphatase family [Colletotrichum orchidophilum]OHE95068.1 endonuclease/exonuclease/phosphatase family [Colletotrichum orchidophilum]